MEASCGWDSGLEAGLEASVHFCAAYLGRCFSANF